MYLQRKELWPQVLAQTRIDTAVDGWLCYGETASGPTGISRPSSRVTPRIYGTKRETPFLPKVAPRTAVGFMPHGAGGVMHPPSKRRILSSSVAESERLEISVAHLEKPVKPLAFQRYNNPQNITTLTDRSVAL